MIVDSDEGANKNATIEMESILVNILDTTMYFIAYD